MQWTQEGDGYRCQRHAELFGRTGCCPKCLADPAPVDDDSEDLVDVAAPDGCRSTGDHERRLLFLADRIAEAGLTLIEAENRTDDDSAGPDYHRVNSGAKLLDTAIKAYRASVDLARTRESEVTVRHRMRELRKLLGQVRH